MNWALAFGTIFLVVWQVMSGGVSTKSISPDDVNSVEPIVLDDGGSAIDPWG